MEDVYFIFFLLVIFCNDVANAGFDDLKAPPIEDDCKDNHRTCKHWAGNGHCRSNPKYMKVHCKKSCNFCIVIGCYDKSGHCGYWAKKGQCKINPKFMTVSCKKSCNLCTGGASKPLKSPPLPVTGPADLYNFKLTMGNDYKLPNRTTDDALYSYTGHGGKRSGRATEGHMCDRITGVPRHLTFITKYNYYRKYTHAYNIPIIGSAYVSDAAMKRACYVLRFLLADRAILRQKLYENRGRIGVIGRAEGTISVPEHRWLGASWNARARGLGGTLSIPISTGTEENLLCEGRRYPRYYDRYPREDIFLHEFSHGIQEVAIRGGGIPDYFGRLQRAYRSARYRGLWRNTYAMSTVQEYFAEGTQSYFNVNDYAPRPNGVHGPIKSRSQLRTYDPTLYRLVKEVFPCGNNIWRRCDAIKAGASMPSFRMNCDGRGPKKVTVAPVTTRPEVKTAKPPTPPKPPIPGVLKCKDTNPYCSSWANRGYCKNTSSFKKYMLKNCSKSCKCCVDLNTNCPRWKTHCGGRAYGAYMNKDCKKTCKTCQKYAS